MTGTWPEQRALVLRESLAVGVAVGVSGLSFGALAAGNGFSLGQTAALSALAFTGASQFAFVGIVGAGGSLAAAVSVAWLLGARNALYGLRLAPLLGLGGWRRAVGAQLVIDESTAVAIAQDDHRGARLGFWVTGATLYVGWNVTTVVGAWAVEAWGDPSAWGLDAAVGAAFLALLWPRLRDRSQARAAAVGAVVALALTPWLTPGLPVLAAGVAAIGLAWPEPGARVGAAR